MIALDLEELRANFRATAFLVATGFTAWLTLQLFLTGEHIIYEPSPVIAGIELVFFNYATVEAVLHFKSQARKHAN